MNATTAATAAATVWAQVGAGRTYHEAVEGASDTLCGMPVSRLLTRAHVTSMRKACANCAKVIARTAAEAQAAEEAQQAPTPDDVVRTDGVTVKANGPGKWIVARGGDFLGNIFDEGPGMKRGRYAGWTPYAGHLGNMTSFDHDPAALVEAMVQRWPVTAAELAAETGKPVDTVLAAAADVDARFTAEGRRGVMRIAAATGPATKMTREAAAAVREDLEERPARYAVPIGTDDRTFPRFNDRAAAVRCAAQYGIEASAITDTYAPDPAAASWGTLKGITAPFRLWGEECDRSRFAPAFDRKRVTGEPLVIVEVWTSQGGTARHGRDATGREVHLYGAATRFWRAPGA